MDGQEGPDVPHLGAHAGPPPGPGPGDACIASLAEQEEGSARHSGAEDAARAGPKVLGRPWQEAAAGEAGEGGGGADSVAASFLQASAGPALPRPGPAAAELGDVQRLLQLAADSALVAEEGSPKVAKAAQSRRRGVMLYAMSSLCVSSMVGIAKMLEHGTGTHPVGKDGVPVLQIVLVRSLVVAGLGLAILGRDRTSPLGQPPCQPLLVLRGLLGSAAVISLFFAAVILPLAEALVLTFVMPLWGSLFGWLFLGEPLQKALLAVFPVCLAGILLLAKPWEDPRSASGTAKGAEAFPHRHLGVAVAVFHAATSAGAKTCVRALGKGGQHPQVIVMYLSIAVLGCSAVGLFGIQDSAVSARPWQWLAMVVAGFCGFGSQTFSTLALRSISVGEGAVVNYLTLVWGELYGVLIFHELPSASSAAGAALVATCTLVLLQQRG